MQTVTSDTRLDGRLTVRTRPADPGPWPGVVMLHEIWGIDEVMRRLADKLAGLGYLVDLPDLLGEGTWLRCIRRAFRALQARAGKPFELIESCRKQLVDDPGCTGKVGVIGFCIGGGFALLASGDGFHASARSTTAPSRMTSTHLPSGLPDGGQLRRTGSDGGGRAGPDRCAASACGAA